MGARVFYEWLLEVIETESGEDDIVEVCHFDTYAGMLKHVAMHPVQTELERYDMGMVCDEGNPLWRRSWATVDGGQLDHEFRDAMGNVTRKMPDRFFHEVNRHHNREQ